MSQNDVMRKGGNRDTFITVSPSGPQFPLRFITVDYGEWITWFDD